MQETRRNEAGRFDDLKGWMFSNAMEEQGCQLLLQKLHEKKPEDIQMIFLEVKDCVCKLMFNRFGSDVILKLFEVCDEEQKNQFVSSITADARGLISVCLDSQGSQTMRKLLGFSTAEKQISRIVVILSYFTVPLANHPCGSHVVAECFRIFPVPAKETQSMLNKIAEYCSEIAVDENGSKLLQILLSEHYIIGSRVGTIAQTVISNFYNWSKDRFGSSVIQHLIGLEKPNLLQDLVHEIQGIFIHLCYHKYGRDVIKKLLDASKNKYASQIMSEIINDPGLVEALVDPDGFSFLNSAKNYAKGTDLKILDAMILQYSQPLKKQ